MDTRQELGEQVKTVRRFTRAVRQEGRHPRPQPKRSLAEAVRRAAATPARRSQRS